MFKRTQPTSTTARRARRAGLALAVAASVVVPAAAGAATPLPTPPSAAHPYPCCPDQPAYAVVADPTFGPQPGDPFTVAQPTPVALPSGR